MSTLTAFKPPASCLATTYTLQPAGSDIMRQYPGIVLSRSANTACFPPGYLSTSYFSITALGYEQLSSGSSSGSSTSCIYTTRGSDFALSPARCPSGYITVATATATPGQTYEYGHTTRTATVTSATCCPSQFTWNGIADCTASSRTKVTYLMGSVTSTAEAYALEEFATPVIVAFEAAKAVQTSFSSAVQSPTSASTSGVAQTTSAPEEQSSEKSLSTGAKASIGAAVTVFVIAIFATIIFILRRRAKRRAKNAETDDSFTKAELPAESKHNTELDLQGALHEAGGLQKPTEAENSSRAELEGDWTGWEAPVLPEIDLSPVEAPSGSRVGASPRTSMERPENQTEGRQTPRG